MKITLVIVLVAAVAGGVIGAVVGLALDGEGSKAAPTAASAAPLPATAGIARHRIGLTPEAIYRRDAPAVVVITSTQTEEVPPTPFAPAMKQRVAALGSGFVIDTKGDIVTNEHVVQGGSAIRVGFSSGASYPATVVGTDPSTDVAVVRVKAPQAALDPLSFDNSAVAAVGDPVYAIGNPFGLDRTMTAGIVSATGRDIQAPNGLTIENAIQTDAPINHGNSGGPLLDRFGKVVGIDAQIEGGTVNANVGVGFAIPADTASSVADELIAGRQVQHAWLGVQVETLDPTVGSAVPGLPSHGAVIARVVAGSPAAKSGLKAATSQVTVNGVGALLGGDVIVEADGRSVSDSQQLSDLVSAHKPGDRLKLEVVRSGKTRTVTVPLGDVPSGTS
jgi:S1-C subfamily serine protease